MTTLRFCAALLLCASAAFGQTPIVLRAARLLDIESGKMLKPGEVLVSGERIVEVGATVTHPPAAEIVDLGDRTLLPGLIDAHVHLFLHPGAEDLQTVEESVPQRTILALLAAKADLMAGFTAERDMGTEGAGSADTAVRNARMRARSVGAVANSLVTHCCCTESIDPPSGTLVYMPMNVAKGVTNVQYGLGRFRPTRGASFEIGSTSGVGCMK